MFAAPTGDALLSLLDWQSTAPVATVDAKIRFPDFWTLRGHIDAATGSGGVVDYDWLAGYDPENWTHRSISPTTLDWYLNGSLAVGRDMPINDEFSVNLNGGFKYTDVKWTAVGGSYVYSTTDFRDTVGDFPDVPVGDFRMQLPEVFLGVDASVKDGPWTLDTSAKAGLTAWAGNTDNHYLRSLRFSDELNWAPVYSAEAQLGFAFNEHLSAFLEGSYETLLSGHGDEHINDMDSGVVTGVSEGTAGAELQVATVKVGLKGNF